MRKNTLELGKRALSAACAVVLAAGLLPAPALAALRPAQVAPLDEPTAQAGDYKYVISNGEELKDFRDDVNAGKTGGDTTVILTDDIEVAFTSTGGSTGNLPIGTAEHPFTGTFDGAGHVIAAEVSVSEYYLLNDDNYPAGVFGVVGDSAELKDFTVTGHVFGAGPVGGAVAVAQGSDVSISGVVNRAEVTRTVNDSPYPGAGGILGSGTAAVSECANHGAVSGGSGFVGGIIGNMGTGSSVTSCYNTATVEYQGLSLNDANRAAGIACTGNLLGQSRLDDGAFKFSNCYNAGEVVCSSSWVTAVERYDLAWNIASFTGECFYATDVYSTGVYEVDGQSTLPQFMTGTATAKTLAEMSDGTFAAALGGAWAESTLAGQATPMLAWEATRPTGVVAYSITAADATGGSVSFSVGGKPAAKATEGDSVTVIVSPDGGYELGALSATDAADHALALGADGRTFTMPAGPVTVTPVFSRVDGDKLSFGFGPWGSAPTEITRDQNLKAQVDLNVEVTDVKKGGFLLGAGDEADIAAFTLQWSRKAQGDGGFAPIEGASGRVAWNSQEGSEGVVGHSTAVPYRWSASLAEAGTTLYKCTATWALADHATATEEVVFTVTVTPAGTTEALAEVATAGDFKKLATSVKAGVDYKGKTVKLTADVDLSGAGGWEAIGTADDPFTGTFDGQGHTVTLAASKEFDVGYGEAFGLFGRTSGATVQNLTVAGSVSGNAARIGAVVGAGSSSSATTLRNVRNLASVTSSAKPASPSSYGSEYAVGGLAGTGVFNVYRCANKGDVTVASPFVTVAGVVGAVQYGSVLESCCNLGEVTNTGAYEAGYAYQLWVAGVACAGIAGSATVARCYNAGAVSAPNAGDSGAGEVAAVLAGAVNNLTAPTVSNSYYLEGTAASGLGGNASARKGTEAPAAKTACEMKYLYASLGGDWKHGGAANASLGGYPALSWEEDYGDLETYTVTFDANGGAGVGSVSVTEGYPVAAPTTPVRADYVFQGWFADGSRARFPFTPEGDVALVAQWTPSTSALTTAINAASAEVGKQGKAYRVSRSDDVEAAKSEVAKHKKFVTPAQLAVLEEAIADAKDLRADAQALGTSRTAADVAAGVEALSQATSAFTALYAAQTGEKIVSLSGDDPEVKVEVEVPAQTYSGSALRPEPVVTVDGDALTYRVDYKLAWASNTEPGTASVTVTGQGAYSGSTTAPFEIGPAPMAGVSVAQVADAPYVAGGAVPEVSATFADGTVKLVEGVDYTVSCSGNDAVGQATATLTAIAGAGKRFTGSKTVTFNVVKGENPVRATARQEKVTVPYSPGALKTVPGEKVFSVTGAAGDVKFAKASGDDPRIGLNPDGTVRVQPGTPRGTYDMSANVIAAGDALYNRGTATVDFKVVVGQAKMSGATVTLSATSFTYNGKVQKPSVKSVKVDGKALSSKNDYTVSYSNAKSKAVKSYTVTVTGKGNYTGKATATYKILKAPTIKAKTTGKKVTVAAAKRAAQSFKMGASTTSGGKLTYSVVKANKNITVSGGTVKLKRGAAKGTHKATVRVKSAAKGAFGGFYKDFAVSFTVR